MKARAVLVGLTGGALLVSLGVLHHGSALTLVRLAVAGVALGATTVVDVREHRIPNRIVLPAAAICAALAGPARLEHGLPALAFVAVLLAISLLQPAALGMGDVKQALLIAVALGAAAAPGLLVGLVLAALAGLTLLVARGRSALATALPLAPFLAAGAAVSLGLT